MSWPELILLWSELLEFLLLQLYPGSSRCIILCYLVHMFLEDLE